MTGTESLTTGRDEGGRAGGSGDPGGPDESGGPGGRGEPGGPGDRTALGAEGAGAPQPRRSRVRIPLISAIAVGCVAALLVAVLATSKSASDKAITSATPLQNKPAPNITGPLLGGGSGGLWPANRGKWVLVDFFASWCVPCQQEQGDLVKFQNAHAGGDAVIFGVRFDDPDNGPLTKMMNDSGAKWPVIDDPNAKIDYSVTGPPESFLISPGGIVLVHIVGPITEPQLEAILNQERLLVSTPATAGGSGSSTPPSTASSTATSAP